MGNFMNYLIFFIYLILGLYFINDPFNLLPLPAVNPWFVLIGGILLIIGGTKYLRSAHSVLGLGRTY